MWLILVLKLFHPGSQVYASEILSSSKRYDLDPLLVAAVIYKESRFNPKCCYKGSHGLMQIQLRPRSCEGSMTAAVQQGLYTPRLNIRRGVKLLAWWKNWWTLHHSHDNYHWLLHYNQGFGKCPTPRCKRSERIPITTDKIGGYADRILNTYHKLQRLKPPT